MTASVDTSDTATSSFARAIGTALLVLAAFALTVALVYLMLFRRQEPDASARHMYLLTGEEQTSNEPLFRLAWDAGLKAFRIESGSLTPTRSDGSTPTELTGSQQLRIGTYHYQVRLTAYTRPDGSPAQTLDAELLGARVRAGDEVGRVPEFVKRGRMTFAPGNVSGNTERFVRLWMDAMPVSAFRVQAPSACGAALTSGAICLRINGGEGRTTIERPTPAGSAPPATFEHVAPGVSVAVSRDDRLWIGHLVFDIDAAPNETGAWDFILSADRRTYRGNRQALGPSTFVAQLAELSPGDAIVADDISRRFRAGHLADLAKDREKTAQPDDSNTVAADERWDPETEDEYQLLVDHEMLCLVDTTIAGRVVPQLQWNDARKPGCAGPLPPIAPTSRSSIPDAVLDVYRRRRESDLLVDQANQRLRDIDVMTPEDIPFVFEWWPSFSGASQHFVPTRLWGVRTMATSRELDVEPGTTTTTRIDPADRPVVLRAQTGPPVVLAHTVGTQRIYQRDNLMGLGPLLGVRGAVDGLDAMVPDIPLDIAASEIQLTIVPELQRRMWATLQQKATQFGTPTSPPDSRRLHGFTAVVMNPVTGDVLAALSWPQALQFENAASFSALRRGRWGIMSPSQNQSMLRADKVGSVLKLLTMYTMADAGVLDVRHPGPTFSCSGGNNNHDFGVLGTTRDGKIDRASFRGGYEDDQRGLIPVGVSGMESGLRASTAASCNTYFAFAATLLLTPDAPDVLWMNPCPIDGARPNLGRTDQGRPSYSKLVMCEATPAVHAQLGRSGKTRTHWLLLPAADANGHDPLTHLRERAFAGLKPNAKGASGFFGHAVDAGFRFLAPVPGGGGVLRRLGEDGYDDVEYRKDWFKELAGAQLRVFDYPHMVSPRAHFGATSDLLGTKTKGIKTIPLPSIDKAEARTWREFGSQAIGEDGQGSALSIAVLYSGVGRSDGNIVAPRLISSASAPPSLQRAFAATTPERLRRLQDALKGPVEPGGTANRTDSVEAARRRGFADALFAKTGTFGYAFRPTAATEKDIADGCGALPQPVPATTAWGQWVGSSFCETRDYTLTSVHHYRATSSEPGFPAQDDQTKRYTSFAGVLTAPPGAPVPAVVFAVISDVDAPGGARAPFLAGPLLEDIWDWLTTPP
jgi:hypothetical protein